MRTIRQRIFSWILIFLFTAGMAVGIENSVMAAERTEKRQSNILVVYFSCTENKEFYIK